MAKNIRVISTGVDFEVLSKDTISRIELGIPGKFSVYNALGAITCALILGIDMPVIAKALKHTKGVKGRVEVVKTPGMPYTVLIDYAHTPDGIFNVLSAVRSFAAGRVVTLFGCGGDRDKTKRPIMGKIAAEMSDFCIVTSDNPRTEDPQAIISDILAGMKGAKCEYVVIPNRKEAIAFALTHGQKDDVIVLAGKGHETYQILKDETIHFDEREVVGEILEQMKA
jgi:UDP-N-acetylmuramoyl-L-alanyl-D-glutamate--2,6-diaminopimelate ligase